MKSSRSAFTLIELLIVIAILGILMALLFPAVQGALDAAKKAQAKNDVVQIATAITGYETEYGRLPMTNTSGQPVSGDLMKALTGATNAGSVPNPRGIVFMEVQTSKKGKSGTNTSGEFVDPWGAAYQVAFDGDYDNIIDQAGTNKVKVMKKAAVWNVPANGSNVTESQKTRRYVTSWD